MTHGFTESSQKYSDFATLVNMSSDEIESSCGFKGNVINMLIPFQVG